MVHCLSLPDGIVRSLLYHLCFRFVQACMIACCI